MQEVGTESGYELDEVLPSVKDEGSLQATQPCAQEAVQEGHNNELGIGSLLSSTVKPFVLLVVNLLAAYWKFFTEMYRLVYAKQITVGVLLGWYMTIAVSGQSTIGYLCHRSLIAARQRWLFERLLPHGVVVQWSQPPILDLYPLAITVLSWFLACLCLLLYSPSAWQSAPLISMNYFTVALMCLQILRSEVPNGFLLCSYLNNGKQTVYGKLETQGNHLRNAVAVDEVNLARALEQLIPANRATKCYRIFGCGLEPANPKELPCVGFTQIAALATELQLGNPAGATEKVTEKNITGNYFELLSPSMTRWERKNDAKLLRRLEIIERVVSFFSIAVVILAQQLPHLTEIPAVKNLVVSLTIKNMTQACAPYCPDLVPLT